MGTISAKPQVAVVQSKRIALGGTVKRAKAVEKEDFELWYDGISVKISQFKTEGGAYHLIITDENTGVDVADEYHSQFIKAVDSAMQLLSVHADSLAQSSRGVGAMIDKLSQTFLEGKASLSKKEKQQMEKDMKTSDKMKLETMFDESFMEDL